MKQTILDKNELEYFFVEESYGGNQDLFPDVTMRDGGCGAIAACESCIYFARTNGIKNLYPHQSQEISWKEYHDFAYVMKHYLCPRPNGIDTLELFMEGFGAVPKVYGGFNINLSYKAFDLSTVFSYSLGGKVLDSSYRGLMDVGEFGYAMSVSTKYAEL